MKKSRSDGSMLLVGDVKSPKRDGEMEIQISDAIWFTGTKVLKNEKDRIISSPSTGPPVCEEILDC